MDLLKPELKRGYDASCGPVSVLISEVSEILSQPSETLAGSGAQVVNWLERKFGGFAALWLPEGSLSLSRFIGSKAIPNSLRDELADTLSYRCPPEVAWPPKLQSFDFSEVAGLGALCGVPLLSRGRCFGVAFLGGEATSKSLTELQDLEAIAILLGPGLDALVQVEKMEGYKGRETRFRTLAEAMPQLVWTTKLDGSTDYANRRCLDYSGCTFGERSGDGWTQAIHAEDLPAMNACWASSISGGSVFEAEYRIRRHDGAYRWHLGRAVPVRSAEGAIQGWVGTATDIHDQKTSQEMNLFLAESSKALVSSLDFKLTLSTVARLSVPEFADWCAVDLFGPEGQIERLSVVHTDPSKVEWAYQLNELYPGKSISKYGAAEVGRTGAAFYLENVTDEVLREAAQNEAHLEHLRQLGLQSLMIVPLSARGRVLGALTFAFAESKRHYTRQDFEVAEELGRRAGIAMDNARLFEDAQGAIRVRDEFLSIASHELRTPLTSLSLNLQMLGRSLTREAPAHPILKAYLDRILAAGKQAKRLGGLVDMLFDVSRLVHGKLSVQPKPMDLTVLCQELALRFADEAQAVGSSIELIEKGDGKGVWDELRVEQALTNLLSNAIKYAPGKPIRLSISGDETTVILVVSDTGKGISESDQIRIFDRFERGSSRGKPSGMGLGLYIVRQIAEAHHGSVSLISRPEEGSTFTLTLPRGGL